MRATNSLRCSIGRSQVPLKETTLVDFLLVGGGLASATAAETLRAGGAKGSIAILSAEASLPYHRPPLSKDFLLKGPEKVNILIHDEAYYRERDIAFHLGARVARVDNDIMAHLEPKLAEQIRRHLVTLRRLGNRARCRLRASSGKL
jgi:hypothetical protein